MEVKGVDLSPIFSENVAAKIVQVAEKGLKQKVYQQSFCDFVHSSSVMLGSATNVPRKRTPDRCYTGTI